MGKYLLILNAGSSSLKAAVFDLEGIRNLASGDFPSKLWSSSKTINLLEASQQSTESLIAELLSDCENSKICQRSEIVGIGHRVVHGGAELVEIQVLDAQIERKILELSKIAPVHNPIAVKVMKACDALLPSAKSFASFDTAFHSSLPESAFIYPLPYKWYEEFGIRRFGFHGINHKYCAEKAMKLLELDPSANNKRIISCHLGNGCSIAAVRSGKCVDTTMGFTPLEGLMMGARSGSIDPGIIFYLNAEEGLAPKQIEKSLNNDSGLLGVSGLSKDMREIEKAIAAGNSRAELAFDLFVQRLAKEICAMYSSLQGADIIIFTGGIGEHSSLVRRAVSERLAFLGWRLDDAANNADTADGVISSSQSKVAILKVSANEEACIAKEMVQSGKLSK